MNRKSFVKVSGVRCQGPNVVTANRRISKGGFARAAHTSRKRLTLRGRLRRVLLSLFFKKIEYIPSTFDIHYSIFAFLEFPLRSGWRFPQPAAVLKPETRHLKPSFSDADT
jgi:hypothetical protein